MNYSTTVYQSNLFIVSSKFIIGLPGHTTFNPNVENYKNKNIVKQLPKIESLNSIDKTNFNGKTDINNNINYWNKKF